MWRKPLSIRTTDFLIKKDNLSRTKFIEGEIDLNELKSGQVLCLVDKFAFTTNNITYAMLGNSRLRYWQFFPASEDGWGKLPVWGYADVIHSYHEEIAEGERLFGYFPLATHLVIEADKATPFNFVDSAAHRRELSPIYNQYSRTGQKGAHEGLQALFRPLFITSFLIDDFLADNGFFCGQTVVISSASSKTAIGTAFLLHKSRADRQEYDIIGLTSSRNVEFVTGLGYYDQVLTYEEIEQLDRGQTAVLVDLSGSGDMIARLHHHYQDNMVYSCLVGAAHGESGTPPQALPGAKPTFFFAPAQIQKLVQEWGGKEFQLRTTQAMMAFLESAQGWLTVKENSGSAAVNEVYQSFLVGDVQPSQGYILSLSDGSGD
jgi:hypothetical protein